MKSFKISYHEKKINFSDETNYVKNEDLLKELHETKCKIDGCNLKKWELAKKFHNDYEYIYTSSNIQKNICKVLPISRSYFKILEIINIFNFFKNECYFSCIAEGPGGFIQCIHDIYNKKILVINKIYAITLISSNSKVPYWNTNIINNPKNSILYGSDSTGDIYKKENTLDYISKNKKCYLVTSDGGFDYSDNYN